MKELESLQALLDKEVSRKDFLLHVGAAILAMIGISSLLKSLLNSSSRPSLNVQDMGSYGASGYSGIPPTRALR